MSKIKLGFVVSLLVFAVKLAAQDTSPTSLAGKSGMVVISDGTGQLAAVGGYRISFSATSSTYSILPISNTVSASAGTYTYTKTGLNTGRISINDTSSGLSASQALVFTSPTTATYSISSNAGSQSGRFVLEDVTTVVSGGGLANMSIRAVVPLNGQVIPGLVLETPSKILVRVGGPALAGFNVSGTLPNPKLAVYSGSTVIASNDDWSSTQANQTTVTSAAQKSGAFAYVAGSKDAAVVLDLNAGSYTFFAYGDTGTSGEILLEVYRVPN